ncbi:MAG: cytochrome o ubiquinol oxidase subunit III [Enterobacterales bacterium]
MTNNIILNDNINYIKNHNTEDVKLLGFWIYLMSDCILFASLFAVYFVLNKNIFDGPSGQDIFNLNLVLEETLILLSSSFTYSMSMISVAFKNKNLTQFWLILTFILGLSFILMEINEFNLLILKGYGPSRSAFLSSFFILVGTHGIHVLSGLIWLIVMIAHIQKNGLNQINTIRLKCLSLFWHFLDIIWICVFTMVYLIGVI